MQTHRKKRVEIFIEAALLKRLTTLLDEAQVSGYSASGRDGAWLSTILGQLKVCTSSGAFSMNHGSMMSCCVSRS